MNIEDCPECGYDREVTIEDYYKGHKTYLCKSCDYMWSV